MGNGVINILLIEGTKVAQQKTRLYVDRWKNEEGKHKIECSLNKDPLLSQFIAPKENQVAKPFLTSKQDKKSHGVPDGYEVDAGNFEFALRCLQPIQPPTLFLN
jgi:hypothetical protein